jgi:integrase/recombinase XerD
MLTRQIGIREPNPKRGPRIHDLRHRFAVSTRLRWYRQGKNVDLLLPVLSTYLGHVFVTGTYWYLTCTPELMEAAAKRLERRWKGSNHAQG